MTKLVVLHEEEKFCKGIHMLLGPTILGDLLDVDIFGVKEAAEGEFMVCLCIP